MEEKVILFNVFIKRLRLSIVIEVFIVVVILWISEVYVWGGGKFIF